MCITWPQICFTIHLLWCMTYIIIGSVQLVSGVFFFVSLPILKLGSNIWIGIWNILFGVGGAVIALIGKWTLQKQRTFLYLAVSVLIANVINLVILEIGEWHILLPESAKKLIEQGNLKMLVFYARTITSLSTIVAAVISFVDSQITFCSMQYHERVYHKKSTEKQDILSDTEYVLPRVKSDSDDNVENATYFAKQYPQSWVFETQTAETSTINSVPNRLSQTSEEPVLDSKQTSSETDFKDISTQNLNVEQPIVVVENTSDYTDRQLHYMASFSRTPSPVAVTDTSSEDSCSLHGPPIQECLEKLTEPSVYQSRLDTALSTSAAVVERPPPSMSPRPPSISQTEQLQHDTLMVELQETISNKSEKIIEFSEPKDTFEVIRETPSVVNTPDTEDEAPATNGDVESYYSSNVSTDKETIIEFKSDDEVEMPCHESVEEPAQCVGICDTLDLIEGIRRDTEQREPCAVKNSNEIDDIFKIAENVEITDDFVESIIRETARTMEPVVEEIPSSEPKDDSISESASESKDEAIIESLPEPLLSFVERKDEDSVSEAEKPEKISLTEKESENGSSIQTPEPMEELVFEQAVPESESSEGNCNNLNKDGSDTDKEEDKDSVLNVEAVSLATDSVDIPPPEIDQIAESTDQETDSSDFAIPPPEDEEDEALNNGVDPDEWDESDDDSVDSSCVQRVPLPPTTPND